MRGVVNGLAYINIYVVLYAHKSSSSSLYCVPDFNRILKGNKHFYLESKNSKLKPKKSKLNIQT